MERQSKKEGLTYNLVPEKVMAVLCVCVRGVLKFTKHFQKHWRHFYNSFMREWWEYD